MLLSGSGEFFLGHQDGDPGPETEFDQLQVSWDWGVRRGSDRAAIPVVGVI